MRPSSNWIRRIAALIAIAIGLAVAGIAPATASALEASFNDPFCEAAGGTTEAVQPDGTRADCITLGYAIETDWAHKWYEAPGQAMHYARLADRLPGVALIVSNAGRDCPKVAAAMLVLERLRYLHPDYGAVPIRLWQIGPDAPCPPDTPVA